MKNVLLAIMMVLVSVHASARDDKTLYSIDALLKQGQELGKLDKGVRLFFGNKKHPVVKRKLGTFTANKKTNAFNKSDTEACNWAALSALMALQSRAIREGGNAVINIKSYYKKNEVKSRTKFECGAGNIMAGASFRGTVVTLK